jgi:hypothetical protein
VVKISTVVVFLSMSVVLPLPASAEWKYSKETDSMRGLESSFAEVTSSNSVRFDFPYNGGSKLKIVFRKKKGKLNAAYFYITKGQFSCGIEDCEGSVRFDKKEKNGTVESISLSRSSDYSSDLLFATNENWFLKRILSSDNLIVELPFYQAGNQQFKFNVANLKF